MTQNGGAWPQWARGGRALYFVEDSRVVEVAVDTGANLSIGSAVEVLPPNSIAGITSLSWSQGFDVNEAGTRFIAVRPTGEPEPFELRVIQNWLARTKN